MSNPRFVGRYLPDFVRGAAWQTRGKCRKADLQTQQEFTYGSHSPKSARPLVRQFCHTCPVKIDCLNWAMDDQHFTGVAGGMLFRDYGGGKRRSPTSIVIAADREGGFVCAVDREKHPKARRRHLVDEESSSSTRAWRAVCGARCTPNRVPDHEWQAMDADPCTACQRAKRDHHGEM